MAEFNFTVDTQPMADEIDSVRGSVAGVTTAVVAMQSAVVIAQQAASKEICKNVDNGFFILMSSQISQKIAECASVMSSRLMLMKRFSDDINRIQTIMQDDYNRISRNYLRTLKSIDEALKNRVTQLDRAAMQLGTLQKNFASLTADEPTRILLYDDDIADVSNRSITATVKQRTSKAMSVLSDNVCGNVAYTGKVEHCLKSDTSEQKQEKFVPLVFIQSDSMFDKESTVENVYTPESDLLGNKDTLVNTMLQNTEAFQWKDIDEKEKTEMRNLVLQRCSSENLDDRIAQEIKRLLDSSTWQVSKEVNE